MSGLGKLGLRRGFFGTGGLNPAQSRHRVFVQAALMEGLSEALKADICAFPVVFSAPSIAASGAKHTRKASNERCVRSESAAALGVRGERWVPGNLQEKQGINKTVSEKEQPLTQSCI